jgi:HrpA-like RNA helicase
MDYVESPSATGITSALEKLYMAGFINGDYQVTIEGFFASKIQKLSVESIKMIFSGYAHGANVFDLVTIAAFLSTQGVFKRKYVMRNPLKLDPDGASYYAKVVWGCEFIDFLFVWDEFCDQIDNLGKSVKGIKGLKEWCRMEKIKFESLIKVADLRTSILENLVQIGLDPFYNGLNLPRGEYSLREIIKSSLSDGVTEVIKIKKCIVDGFRMNILMWNPKSKKYIGTYRKLPIWAESPLLEEGNMPQYVITGSVAMIESQTIPGAYEFSARTLSVLDEFVDVDLELPMR